MRALIVVVVLLISVVASALSWADVVELKNGDRLTGTVDSVSDGRVLLDTEYAGHVPISLDAIAHMSTEGAFTITSASGKTDGQFAVVEGQQVLRSDGVDSSLVLTDVNTAGQNNLALVAFASEWSSRADLAAKISNGNTNSENYSALVESILKKERVEHSLTLLINDETAEGVQTIDELSVDYGYKRFLSKQWYLSGNAGYFEDPLKGVDSRFTLGAGAGYQFWDNSFGSFSSDLGISYVKEELDGENETNPALRWGLDYKKYLMSKKLEVFHKHSLLFIPDNDRGQVFASSTGLRYALNSSIDAITRVDFRHETKPAPGNSRSDVTYNIGVGIKF